MMPVSIIILKSSKKKITVCKLDNFNENDDVKAVGLLKIQNEKYS